MGSRGAVKAILTPNRLLRLDRKKPVYLKYSRPARDPATPRKSHSFLPRGLAARSMARAMR